MKRHCSLLVLGRWLWSAEPQVWPSAEVCSTALSQPHHCRARKRLQEGSDTVQARIATAAAAAVAVTRAGPPPCRAAGARRSGTRPGPRRSLAKCKQAAVVRGNGGARAELGSSRSERQAGASAHLRQSTPCCSPRQATALPLPGSSWYTPSSVSLLPQMTFHASSQNSNQNRPSGAPDHTTARRPDHTLLCGTLARPRPAD